MIASPRIYYADVPIGVREGEFFNVLVNRTIMRVQCPVGCHPGDKIEIKLLDISNQASLQTTNVDDIGNDDVHIQFGMMFFLTDVVVLVFVILAYSIIPYATQYISSTCYVDNSITQQPISRLYYFLFDGLSSSVKSCTNSNGNFCIYWSDTNAWDYFVRLCGTQFYESANISYDWKVVQVMIPLTSGIILIALVLHGLSVFKRSPMFLSLGSLVLLLSAIVGIVAFNIITYSFSTSASVWLRFYSEIFSTSTVAPANFPITVVNSPNNCNVTITYTYGGSLLATAFTVTIVAFAVLACLGACRLFTRRDRSTRHAATGTAPAILQDSAGRQDVVTVHRI